MLKHFKKLWTGEEGQGMAEYGLILALVAVVVIVALKALGQGINSKFNDVTNGLNGTTPTTP
ncbi:Flp family type IVb pilin [Thermoanaerobacteraceae bacterium SP2]|jgi:pilus assembly protein Flp/PilA|nr:Flp family type IVb pilin [Thermoanaerobacteraceae bacterium SP2]